MRVEVTVRVRVPTASRERSPGRMAAEDGLPRRWVRVRLGLRLGLRLRVRLRLRLRLRLGLGLRVRVRVRVGVRAYVASCRCVMPCRQGHAPAAEAR